MPPGCDPGTRNTSNVSTRSWDDKYNLGPGGRIGLYLIAHLRKITLLSCAASRTKTVASTSTSFATRLVTEKRDCELLRTDSALHPGHIVVMMKKKQDRIERARKIISSVKREMQRPRLTESVRRNGEGQVGSSVGVPSARSKGA